MVSSSTNFTESNHVSIEKPMYFPSITVNFLFKQFSTDITEMAIVKKICKNRYLGDKGRVLGRCEILAKVSRGLNSNRL